MKQFSFVILCGLLLLPHVVYPQYESAITSGGGSQIGSAQDESEVRVYIVQLRAPSAADYHATLTQKLAPTTFAAPGQEQTRVKLEKGSAAMQSYAARLEQDQGLVLQKAGGGVRQIYSYKYGLNGFAAKMSIAQAQKLEGLPEVLNVWEDEVRPLATRHSPGFLGLFDGETGLRSQRELDGSGIIIGVIDSGITPEHPSLQDSRKADRPRACRSSWSETTLLGKWLCGRYDDLPDVVAFDPPEDWSGSCETGVEFAASDCNNKVIGARWFIEGAENTGPIDENEFRSPRDADGHGTHTATTAAGNRASASIFGTRIGDIEGIAPKARIAVYKACWIRPGETRASCNTSDLAHAIDAAVADGVDIINYSVGNSKRELVAADDVALMAAAKAGVVAVVAAGNEGPGLHTIGSPAGGPWVITAAASSRTGESSVEAMQISAPPSIAGKYASKEARFTPPLSDRDPLEASLVLADDDDASLPNGKAGVTSDGCQPLVNGAEISGNIALLQRSGCTFTEMVRNAEDAGAIAAVIYNIAGDPVVMFGDEGVVDIPALMIGQADGNLILAELDAGNEVSAVLEKSLLLTTSDDGNEIANFSARGPGPSGEILKPDLTAPGVNILAGFTPTPANATPGESFAYLSGTSMSTPHIAGVAALLRQAQPNWSPAAIRSAMMTTARQDLSLPDNDATPHPFDYGAGHIVANDAYDPGLVYDNTNDEYDAFACGTTSPAVTSERCDELAAAGLSFHARDLNQPAVAISRFTSRETVSRRVTNLGDEATSYSIEIDAPPGIDVIVEPSTISVASGGSASFDVTLEYQSGPLDLWRFGAFTWVSEDHSVRSTIAVKPTSINAPAEIVSVGGSGSKTFAVEFGYNGSYTPRVHGLTQAFIRDPNVEPPGFVDNDPSKTFTRRTSNGVTQHVRRVTENQLFARFSLFDALTDGDDDLDLYVYYCGPTGSFCTRVGESGSQTSAERVDIYRPTAGLYAVYVHGFETDEINGGPGANYSLLAWSFGVDDDRGNMSVSGPAFVGAGTTGDVTVNWSGLGPNNLYLGGISHNTPQGLSELTIVTIGN